MQLLHVGGLVYESADILPVTKRQIQLAWVCSSGGWIMWRLARLRLRCACYNASDDGDPSVWVCDVDLREHVTEVSS